ncbi:dipeptidase [Mediannikoviicoccus vaginalis]|uniref:dipeptidase n=1 Tax=Mediannikoviicoccus vaginalis TaxID=2899727 RepID=UPI001F2E9A10|nr:membrane dipeptidase [Mediannikoviicoccus vaginalis]
MYIDLHCDTVLKYIEKGDPEEIYQGKKSHLGLKELHDLEVKAQFMAIFLPSEEEFEKVKLKGISDWDYVEKCLDFYKHIEETYPDKFKVTKDYNEYTENRKNNIVSLFPTIEDGRLISKVEDVKTLRQKGLTLITLLWNNENSLGFPHKLEGYDNDYGLKKLGIEVIKEMEEQKIIIDVSHLNEHGIEDVLKNTTKPFMASHSNARAITDVTRNLSDKQLKDLGERGCVAGLNLCPRFATEERAAIFSDYEKHIRHMLNLGGEDLVAIGSDFDGIGGEFEIKNPHKMIDFLNYLNMNGVSADVVDKIAYKNVERFFKEYY